MRRILLFKTCRQAEASLQSETRTGTVILIRVMISMGTMWRAAEKGFTVAGVARLRIPCPEVWRLQRRMVFVAMTLAFKQTLYIAHHNRGHFFAAAAEAMRRILIDNARKQNSLT